MLLLPSCLKIWCANVPAITNGFFSFVVVLLLVGVFCGFCYCILISSFPFPVRPLSEISPSLLSQPTPLVSIFFKWHKKSLSLTRPICQITLLSQYLRWGVCCLDPFIVPLPADIKYFLLYCGNYYLSKRYNLSPELFSIESAQSWTVSNENTERNTPWLLHTTYLFLPPSKTTNITTTWCI